MPVLTAVFFGLITGSFLNVCIMRMPYRQSVIFPGSHCQSCRAAIAWFDNIPVLSYLVLRGRCRFCRCPISAQYPLVEILTAALFAGFYLRFGWSVIGAVYLYLGILLLLQAVIDFKHQIIPDAITLPGMAAGAILSIFFPELQGQDSRLWAGASSLFGIFLGGGILYVAGTAAERLLKKEAMGGGDVKLLAMIGAFVGWQGVFWSLFIGSLIGSVIGIYLRLVKGEEGVPFGPYLATGALFYIFFGDMLFNWYFGFLAQ